MTSLTVCYIEIANDLKPAIMSMSAAISHFGLIWADLVYSLRIKVSEKHFGIPLCQIGQFGIFKFLSSIKTYHK